MFGASAGVYDRIIDRSFVVSGGGLLAGGVVISSKRGPVGINTITSAREFIDTYGIPSRDNPSMYAALRFIRRAGILTVYRVVNDAVAAKGSFDVEAPLPTPMIEFTAASPGAWGNSISIEFAGVDGVREDVFVVIVYDSGEEVERWEVSRDPDAKNGFGNNIYIEEVINKRSAYIRVNDDPSVEGSVDYITTVSLEGGSDDTLAPTSGQIIQAWEEFKNTDLVPAQILINSGWATAAIQQKMLEVAETRKDAVAILDVPQDTATDVAAMIEYRKTELGANTYFGGIYGGWLRVYDEYNDREVTIPPSGDVAAVFVHTVEVAERWDAPAGLQRGIIPNALGVSKVLTEGERDMLYVAGINPVTTLSGASAVVWGQKTLQVAASALDRFGVVNSVLWINQRVVESLQPYVFQPNTPFTRDSVNTLISSFLESIQMRGGLYAFSVDTSERINTPQAIDNNEMYVELYIQPVKHAEFIRVSTIITRTGVSLA